MSLLYSFMLLCAALIAFLFPLVASAATYSVNKQPSIPVSGLSLTPYIDAAPDGTVFLVVNSTVNQKVVAIDSSGTIKATILDGLPLSGIAYSKGTLMVNGNDQNHTSYAYTWNGSTLTQKRAPISLGYVDDIGLRATYLEVDNTGGFAVMWNDRSMDIYSADGVNLGGTALEDPEDRWEWFNNFALTNPRGGNPGVFYVCRSTMSGVYAWQFWPGAVFTPFTSNDLNSSPNNTQGQRFGAVATLADKAGNEFLVGAATNNATTLTGTGYIMPAGFTWGASFTATIPSLAGTQVGGSFVLAAGGNRAFIINGANIDVYSLDLPPVTLTYAHGQGGSGGVLPPAETVNPGDKLTAPPTPTRPGYTFTGWHKTSNWLVPANLWDFDNDVALADNFSLYAGWTQDLYTITWNTNGGLPVPSTVTRRYNESINAPTPPAKAGFTFMGWYSDDEFIIPWNATMPVTHSMTLHAKFDPNTYSITFNSNGGSAVSSQSILHGLKATRPTDPTRTDYTFGGWWATSNLSGAEYDFGSPVYAPITLYAKWKLNQCVITFDAIGGTPVPAQVTVLGETRIPYPAVDPVRSGMIFGGWYTGTGKSGDAWNFAYDVAIADMTLYAYWQYPITGPNAWDPNQGRSHNIYTVLNEYNQPSYVNSQETATGTNCFLVGCHVPDVITLHQYRPGLSYAALWEAGSPCYDN